MLTCTSLPSVRTHHPQNFLPPIIFFSNFYGLPRHLIVVESRVIGVEVRPHLHSVLD